MIKKTIAAAFASAGLLVAVAPAAGAARPASTPPAAACHGLGTAHSSVPHFDNHGTHTAHMSIPHCPMSH